MKGVRVILLSYAVVEQSGGPGVAATGFSAGLARLGADVTLVALDNVPGGKWIVDEERARAAGYALVRIGGTSMPLNVAALSRWILSAWARDKARLTVLWVNGIWGAQSLSAALTSRITRWPYLVRPAGSLGVAALRYRSLKKKLYYRGIEARVMRGAAAIHCMSKRELEELPAELRDRAFVVPTGVDIPPPAELRRVGERAIVGILARIHPIKRQLEALDACEALIRRGRDFDIELAGSVSDPHYLGRLRARVESSPLLAPRVRFLGHVERERLPEVVGRWRASVLLSEQENFGHAVVTAAALGVPTLAAPGVGLAEDLAAAGAGCIATPAEAADALGRLLDECGAATAERCRAFAQRYRWDTVANALAVRLEGLARRGVAAMEQK